MATIILGAAGAAIGGSMGGGVLGLSSVLIGRAVGATLGRVIDQTVLGAGSEPVEAGRVDRFRVMGAGEGGAVAQVFGRLRVGGQVIWASKFREHVSITGGGKGSPVQPEVNQYSYSVSLALALFEGRIARVGRIWADGLEIERDSIDYRVYRGGESQVPDPAIGAAEGAGNVPACRGIAYVVIENLDLARFGNRVPGRGHWLTGRSSSRTLSPVVRAICSASDVERVEADALYGSVRGFGIDTIGSARSALQPLMLAYGFDAIERDGKLIFRSRNGRITGEVSPDRVAVTQDSGGDIVAVRNPDADRVGRVKLNFVGADGDFQIRTTEA